MTQVPSRRAQGVFLEYGGHVPAAVAASSAVGEPDRSPADRRVVHNDLEVVRRG
jgi:hypothetical protein